MVNYLIELIVVLTGKVKWVSLEGRELNDWLKCSLKVRWVSVNGRLFSCWLNKLPKERCMSEDGKVLTG